MTDQTGFSRVRFDSGKLHKNNYLIVDETLLLKLFDKILMPSVVCLHWKIMAALNHKSIWVIYWATQCGSSEIGQAGGFMGCRYSIVTSVRSTKNFQLPTKCKRIF